MSDAYCKDDDLLLTSGVTVGNGDKPKFINIACDEINAKLGFVYATPLDLEVATTTMPPNQVKLIKTITAKLATGRLLMSTALGGQSESINSYALYLVKEAEMDLMSIANGSIDLNAPRVSETGAPLGVVQDPSVSDPRARVPGGWAADSVSPVTVFEKNFMGGTMDEWWYAPSDNIVGDGKRVDLQ